MAIKATEIFTPGFFPEHTYVERAGEHLERDLRDGLDTPGQIVSLAGPSKSGKTVLVEKVVGRENLITIQGTGIQRADQAGDRVLDWMNTPAEEIRTQATTAEVSAGAKVGQRQEHAVVRRRTGLQQVVTDIGDSDFVVLLDDFHYMDREVQAEVAKILKEGCGQG